VGYRDAALSLVLLSSSACSAGPSQDIPRWSDAEHTVPDKISSPGPSTIGVLSGTASFVLLGVPCIITVAVSPNMDSAICDLLGKV